ncbi:hypothetical protein BHE90_009803 [Fusarium euwallaceae]|uniref:Uncharacterized protein n=1 Tax=Fusarium euwallaceae TaxID=1147111 RepID=A0A430LJ36_9HYPO|nr:hypothetical protein BHE90_009803 [Fusarium euwallaceae]
MGPPSDNFELHSVRTVTNDAPRRQTGLAKEGKLLRYRERSAWIFAFYFPLLILPWMFTAILMFRPINLHSYLNQTGIYRPKDITYLKRFRLAVDVLTQIAATLGIPIVSTLLAHGAVVYTQRRRSGQHLDLLQLFTLADRQWLNVRYIWKSLTTLPKNWNSSSTYFRLAAGLIFITAVQPPLQSVLVRDETIPIMTCYPNACKYNNRDTWIVGSDADPEGLAESPSTWIIQRTSEKIISVDEKDTQLNLWSDTPYWLDRYSTARLDKRNFQWALGLLSDESEHLFFTSSVPNGTSTGIFRYHAVRMDSKAKCTKGSSSSSSCKGTRPFTASLSLPYTNVEVCVDGNQDANPWTLSRDKQEIKERLLLQVSSWHDNAYYGSENFTIECESVSRRGWFELPNYHNGYKPGPLLDVWPSEEELARDFNDDISEGFWLENDEPTPGPLMTAGLAMFGNTSFFHLAAMRLPFTRLTSSKFPSPASICDYRSFRRDPDYNVLDLLGRYFAFLGADNMTQNALDIAMYFANEALLTGRSDRPLYYNPGVMVTKPKKSLPALVVITVLVGLQAIGLCLLMAFIYSTPTWTVDLDADALTQIGAQLKDLDEIMSRNQVCGLVGTVEDRGNDETSSVRASSIGEATVQVRRPFHLSLGGEGIISPGLLKEGRSEGT